MQTSLRRKHRDRVVRRGLALIIESDFYATDAGRQHFADRALRASNPIASLLAPSTDSRDGCLAQSLRRSATASRRRARPSRFEPRPLNPHARVASVSRLPRSCADLQLRHALRRAFASFKPPSLSNQPSESAPLPTLTRPPFVRAQYLTCGNYDFNVSLTHSSTALPLRSLPMLTLCPSLRSTTAPRIFAPSATSGRR